MNGVEDATKRAEEGLAEIEPASASTKPSKKKKRVAVSLRGGRICFVPVPVPVSVLATENRDEERQPPPESSPTSDVPRE
jgi:hypothetical protein